MNKGHCKDYNFRQKRIHRRNTWKTIKKSLIGAGKKINKCSVLYLSGAEDLDREVAVSLGFSPNNFISVEAHKETAILLKKKNVTTINGTINNVLQAVNRQFDVVFLDLCCGITENTYQTASELIVTNAVDFINGSCIYINLLRGRDGASNSVRDYISNLCINPFSKDNIKHRGFHFLMLMITRRSELERDVVNKHDATGYDFLPDIGCMKLDSYKSGKQYMDSLLIFSKNCDLFSFCGLYKKPKCKISGKINAAFAVQTMRRSGVLKPSPHKHR